MRRAIETLWKWRWVIALNVFLLSPVLLYELRIGQGGVDKAILFVVAASVLWVLAAQLAARRAWVPHAVMFPLYVVVATDLYVITHYNTRLSAGMLLTIFENLEDAREFLQTHWVGVVTFFGVALVGYAVALIRIRKLTIDVPRSVRIAPFAALLVLYVGVHHMLGLWMWVVTNDRNSPFGIFPQAYTTVSLYREALADAKKAEGFAFHSVRAAAPAEPEIYVLVVGESSRAMNWQLFGYGRPTNPRLAAQKDLVLFRNAVTQAAVTRKSVPLILTRGTIEDEDRTARERSIVTAFREAGFWTYWLSTQQRDPFTGAINRYPREADVTRFYERRGDAQLVDTMKQLLADDAGAHPKKFFVLHTMGSHFNTRSRYPREFAVFPDEDARLGDQQLLVNSYDDTIVYTDAVLAGVVDVLQGQPGLKGMFYTSDHGENLRDDARRIYGHYQNNEYDLPIPMLFWPSKELALAEPGKIAAARVNSMKPLNTRVVFHSLLDLAGIDVHDPETPRLSVFNASFAPMRRMVLGEPRPFDYDEWMARRRGPGQHASLR